MTKLKPEYRCMNPDHQTPVEFAMKGKKIDERRIVKCPECGEQQNIQAM